MAGGNSVSALGEYLLAAAHIAASQTADLHIQSHRTPLPRQVGEASPTPTMQPRRSALTAGAALRSQSQSTRDHDLITRAYDLLHDKLVRNERCIRLGTMWLPLNGASVNQPDSWSVPGAASKVRENPLLRRITRPLTLYCRLISKSFHLGYFRGAAKTLWVGRLRARDKPGHETAVLGETDGNVPGSGEAILNWKQALDKASARTALIEKWGVSCRSAN
jgi:hypothetical protein